MATMTARELENDIAAAMSSATTEPLIITEHGQPAFVLLTIAEFERMSSRRAA